MKIILPKERPMSWNKMYSGMHWTKRREEAERVHWLILSKTTTGILRFKNKVSITISVFFDRKPLDPDNITSKFYIDGLRFMILKDDTYEWIDSVTTKSRIDKINPRVEIDIYEV